MKKTQPFTTTSGDYLTVLLSLWIPRYGWTVIVPIAVCAAVGVTFDVRFLLISFMLLFIVVPMLMSFLYTYYMLAPEARRAVIRKEVEICDGESIRLIYLPPEDSDDNKRKAESRMLLPIADEKEREKAKFSPLPVPEPEIIPWENVISVKNTTRFTVYILKAPRLHFLLVPHSSFLREGVTT